MILKVENLNKSYNQKKAVNNVSIEVEQGEIFALLGPNGAGKTTTIKTILGLRKKDSGEIKLFGKYAYLPEKKQLYKYLTVRKMLEITANISKYFSLKKANQFVKEFEIPLEEKISKLSHGMLTQLYLSIVLSEEADIYFLDEATEGLDPMKRLRFFELIRNFSYEGKSFFYTSHVIPEVEKIADKVAIMVNSKVVEMDYLDNIKDKFTACVVDKNNSLDGFLYRQTENEKVYVIEKDKVNSKQEPVTFDMIFEAIVKHYSGGRKK
ncbi:multidrug ABC transporter ATP-binding protein [Petrotoga sp. 9PW.55.5.1]|uniref:ABC transporter ATP-binding protein n=1 Tax=Petrotoga sp. 9PW.55.5.1 TaxID=1308979 RepID=UPI000DC3F1D1|nr:ATP-binding cassette domain-containing protein [Petrotoga sp. 9PW.55.5.1]RAO99491.1 multidrug ABC transporter ATP-binding protein [Petrotoga sp. 9PW.55.5.1]